ncbi:MAG: DUF5667 domain-containing protein [bacterium]|nr:DUF5667 domain-containing protein [bacterium]
MRDDLEKILTDLPKPKLSFKADFKIKYRLYWLILTEKTADFFNLAPLKSHALRNAVIISLIVIVASSGTSLYAYSNGNITPGSGLYGLKRAVEKVEERAAQSASAKAAVWQKLSQRRLEEALRLSQDHLPASANSQQTRVSGYIKNNIDEAVANINSALAASPAAGAVKAVKQTENRENYYLDEIEKNVELTGDNELLEKINQARTAFKLPRQEKQAENEKQAGELIRDEPAAAAPIPVAPAQTAIPPRRLPATQNKPKEKKVEGVKIINHDLNNKTDDADEHDDSAEYDGSAKQNKQLKNKIKPQPEVEADSTVRPPTGLEQNYTKPNIKEQDQPVASTTPVPSASTSTSASYYQKIKNQVSSWLRHDDHNKHKSDDDREDDD